MKTLALRMALVASLVTLAFGLVAPMASADAIYHSQHIPLSPVGRMPLRTGFVENIHADGPVVFAHELDVLNGAVPNASFQVAIVAFPNTACSGAPFATIPTTTISTNAAGDGQAERIFSVAEATAKGFRNVTVGVFWEMLAGTRVAYRTACSTVTVD